MLTDEDVIGYMMEKQRYKIILPQLVARLEEEDQRKTADFNRKMDSRYGAGKHDHTHTSLLTGCNKSIVFHLQKIASAVEKEREMYSRL